jgi:Protein of unknown function (DUF3300)
VKSPVEFPDVLTLMDQKLDWIQKLGDAFLGQQKELLDAVQRLRARAQAQGNRTDVDRLPLSALPRSVASHPAKRPRRRRWTRSGVGTRRR